MIQKIISGGQTGVDRAALDVAIQLGIKCGGWCPKGRLAEDGPIDFKYPLKETKSDRYDERTRQNIMDSDGTLILKWGTVMTGGTKLTFDFATQIKKPMHIISMSNILDIEGFHQWIEKNKINILNVAGPRESNQPGKIYFTAFKILKHIFSSGNEFLLL